MRISSAKTSSPSSRTRRGSARPNDYSRLCREVPGRCPSAPTYGGLVEQRWLRRPAHPGLARWESINGRADHRIRGVEQLVVPLIASLVVEFQTHAFLELGRAGLLVRG